ncbi:MAG: tetratricopeptide repeat protein [Planctomycetota bacterium]|nr:tetratricopeptide repeat protein [Planctomycetota bacterium]
MLKRLGLCVVLIALVVVGFWPAFRAEFVAWDDDRNFLQNIHYRGLAFENLRWMFTTFHMGPYQPFAWLTLGFDHTLFGMDPRGYHAMNVAWHAATVVLFFFLARVLLESARPSWGERMRDGLAFVAALAFGLHPLRVESVAWVTERRDVVSGAFCVATALAWIVYARSSDRRGRKYATALTLFACALLSKASVVTLPIVFFVLDVWPLKRWAGDHKRLVLEKLPFLALSGIFSIIAIVGQSSTGTALRALADHGLGRRVAQASYAAVFQTGKTLFPADLSPIYDMPSPFVATEARFLIAITIVVAASTLAFFLRRSWPAASWSWFAFLVLLAPVSGLVSTGPQLVADRYSYLACMPFALLFAGSIGLAIETKSARIPGIAIAIVACSMLVFASRSQTQHWRSSMTLWERAYAVDPQSAVACDHLGNVRVEQSQAPGVDVPTRLRLLDEAIALYVRAQELAPHPNHFFNIGGALIEYSALVPERRTQELELAAQTMKQGLDFAAETTGVEPKWRVMFASALVELKRHDEARFELDRVLRDDPDHIAALQWSARVAFETQRVEEGLAMLRRTTELDPENPRVWSILAAMCAELGRAGEAESVRRRAQDLRSR